VAKDDPIHLNRQNVRSIDWVAVVIHRDLVVIDRDVVIDI